MSFKQNTQISYFQTNLNLNRTKNGATAQDRELTSAVSPPFVSFIRGEFLRLGVERQLARGQCYCQPRRSMLVVLSDFWVRFSLSKQVFGCAPPNQRAERRVIEFVSQSVWLSEVSRNNTTKRLHEHMKMSNKKCARCEKTVYPIEELKCLDKVRPRAIHFAKPIFFKALSLP